jgi:drug/metabolite transporter (DMT)-like permease
MKLERKVYATRGEKVGDFVIGIGVWFGINIVLGFLLAFGAGMFAGVFASLDARGSENIIGLVTMVLNCLPFVLNGAALVFFAFTRHWIALGMAAAFGVSILLMLCAAVLLAGVCFAAMSGAIK